MRQLLKDIFRFYLHNEYIFTLVTILVMKKYRLFIFPVVLALLLSSVTAIIMMIGQQTAYAQGDPSACPDPDQPSDKAIEGYLNKQGEMSSFSCTHNVFIQHYKTANNTSVPRTRTTGIPKCIIDRYSLMSPAIQSPISAGNATQ